MRRLHMPIQIRPDAEILAAQMARERALAGVRAHVDGIARRPIEGAGADGAEEFASRRVVGLATGVE